jgi:hypothetical protein
MAFLGQIFSAISAGLQIALKFLGLKNSAQEQASADAKTEQAVDEANTKAVQDAIKSGNVDDLRK